MVRRVETIKLSGNKQSEVIKEFEDDVKKRTEEGWVLLTYSSCYKYVDEFYMKYEMERRFIPQPK